MPAVIFFVDVGRQVGLQDYRPEVVADESAQRELALFLISRKRRVQIGGVITDGADLPLSELLRRGEIDVQEVRVDRTWTSGKRGLIAGLQLVTLSICMPQMAFAVRFQPLPV